MPDQFNCTQKTVIISSFTAAPTFAKMTTPVKVPQSPIEQFVNTSALKIFEERSNLRLPMCHSVQKFCFSKLAFAAGLTLPPALGFASLYYGASHVSPYDLLTETGLKVASFFGGLFALHKLTPLSHATNALVTLTTGLLTYGIIQSANSLHDHVAHPYNVKEQEVETEKARLKELLVKELLTNMYKKAADELLKAYNAAYNDPVEMYKLKEQVKLFESQEEDMKQAFEQIGLSASDRTYILRDLETAMSAIRSHSLDIRANDPRYNAKLLKALPEEAFKTIGLTPEIASYLKLGAIAPLGKIHQIKSGCLTTLAAATCGATSAVAAVAMGNLLNSSIPSEVFSAVNFSENTKLEVTVVTAAAAIPAGIVAGRKMHQAMQKSNDINGFKTIEISNKVLNLPKEVQAKLTEEANKSARMIKGLRTGVAAFSGLAVAGVTAAVSHLLLNSTVDQNCFFIAGAVNALVLTPKIVKYVWNKKSAERDIHNAAIVRNNGEASARIIKIYSDISDYISAHRKDFTKEDLVGMAKKLALIEKQIAAYALPNPSAATQELREKLQKMIAAYDAPKVRMIA